MEGSQKNCPMLSVVIPVHNEKVTIGELLRRVNAIEISKEIIIVDDCSTDGTTELLRGLLNSHCVQESATNVPTGLGLDEKPKVLFHDKNQGKGAALRTGFAHANGEIVIVQDADLEYNPKDYLKLVRPLIEGNAEVVFGSRFLTGEEHRVLYFWHSVGNRFLTLLSNMFTNLNLTDMECGYKVFRRDILQRITIEESRFGFEPEIVAKVARQRVRVYEVGVSYAGRTYDEGKKITWKDGIRALWCIIKYSGVFKGLR